jgi:hypothetical protein
MITKTTVIVISIVTGVALELVIHALSGRREGWDSPQFWTIGLPAAFAIAAAMGYLSRGRDWLWTWLIVPGQVMTMMVRNGEIGGLWPLTVILSGILSAPFIAMAFVGSRFRRPSA